MGQDQRCLDSASALCSTMITYNEPLDERKQRILKAVVHDYTSTAEPVSSEMLAYRYRLGVKPATIRNEMAEMSELGYLRQPHTSAGRVPSDMGYRFYVDRLMSGPGLSSAEEDSVAESYSQAPMDIESILQLTCRLMSVLTNYASIATEPAAGNACVRHITLSQLDSRKALLVLLVTDGRVEHSIVDLPKPVSARKLERLCKAVSGQLCGRALEDLAPQSFYCEPAEAADMAQEYKIIFSAVRRLTQDCRSGEVYLHGAGHILSQPEFKDASRLEGLLSVLERRTVLLETLRASMSSPDATIVIGAENAYSEMSDCSFVSANYRIGAKLCGAIGVLGPTRLNYRRSVATVNLLAQSLSDILSGFSVG